MKINKFLSGPRYTFIFLISVSIFFINTRLTASECFKCHQDFEEKNNKIYIHPPVKDKECETCHDDHGKTKELVLKAPIEELCSMCHDFADDNFKKSHADSFLTPDKCLRCHNPHSSNNVKLLHNYEHTPFRERKCMDCHIINSESIKLKLPLTELCRSCHSDKTAKDKSYKYHMPFLSGKCITCHDPHVTNYENILKEDKTYICINACHFSIREDDNPHPPVRERKCLSCHSPHFSRNKYLLVPENNKNKMNSLNDLCKKCHPAILENKYIHLIVLTGECDICHKNHNTKEKNLLINPEKAGCYQNCHESKEKKYYKHKPVVEDKCTVCHTPHSASNKKLLLTQDNKHLAAIGLHCYKCHKPFEYKSGIHKMVQQRKCDECHVEIHSSQNKKFLKTEVRKLCISCHEEKNDPSNHNIAKNKICTECHDPHYPKQQ